MLCSSPINIGKLGLVGCGQCLSCRINKRREWVHRIMLETHLHADNCFATLTYDDDYLPGRSEEHPGGSLNPLDMQLWLKRFRKENEPSKIRFYGVGEYGDQSERAHFHFALFGYPTCRFGQTRVPRNYNHADYLQRRYCCAICDVVHKSWGKGAIYLGTLDEAAANYIGGYVIKKMTSSEDIRLNGRHPEFSRMSLRPGIGADAMHDVASVMLDFDLVEKQGDVPSSLRHGKRLMPLGRYLRRKLRLYTTGTPDAPDTASKDFEEEMQYLREISLTLSKDDQEALRAETGYTGIKGLKIAADMQRLRNIDAKFNLFKRKPTL